MTSALPAAKRLQLGRPYEPDWTAVAMPAPGRKHSKISSKHVCLEPIEHLEKIAKYDGEGFSIVTIQCSLIEFLASTLEGRNYRLIKKGEPGLGLYEYSASKCMFIKFLANQHPFREAFDKETATKFYEAVRCGLLHEARTKAGWRIRFGAGSEPAVDGKAKIVYRNKLGEAFSSFIEWYRENLPKNQSLQQAFVRRFDSLCVE